MGRYVAAHNRNFQPMNATFGIMAPLEGPRVRNKKERCQRIAQRALQTLDGILPQL